MENFSVHNLLKETTRETFLAPETKPAGAGEKFRGWVPYILGTVVLIFLANLVFLRPPEDFPTDTIVYIKEGISLRSISRGLEKNGIIRSRVAFETFATALYGERGLQHGGYIFEEKLSLLEVVRRLARGDRNLPKVKVTVPEGASVEEVARIFVPQFVNFRRNRFLSEATPLEGRLFPDTYFFLPTDDEGDVLRTMTANFEKKISPLRERIADFGYSELEVLVMAALIEKEAKGDADRETISGILWKRLRIGMPLQADADRRTYEKRGLPEDPIANPGLASIKAALAPKDSPYLYYLHDKSGIARYARTLSEHNANIEKYLR